VNEILEIAISPWVLPLTILIALGSVYWLLALLGTVDLDALNFDFDADVDADGDVHTDGFFAATLKLVNGVDVPFMLVMTVLKIIMWFFSILYHTYVSFAAFWWGGLLGLVISFVLGCIVTRYVMVPLKPLFQAFKKGEDDEEPILGVESVVVSGELTSEYGRVEVPRSKGAPAVLNCRLPDGGVTLKKGTKVILYTKDKETDLYLAKKI